MNVRGGIRGRYLNAALELCAAVTESTETDSTRYAENSRVFTILTKLSELGGNNQLLHEADADRNNVWSSRDNDSETEVGKVIRLYSDPANVSYNDRMITTETFLRLQEPHQQLVMEYFKVYFPHDVALQEIIADVM